MSGKEWTDGEKVAALPLAPETRRARGAYRRCHDGSTVRTRRWRGTRPQDVSERFLALRGAPTNDAEEAVASAAEAARLRLLNRRDVVGDVWESSGQANLAQVSDVTATVSSPPDKALLLYRLARRFRPSVIVEFGTGLGLSAAYLCYALRDNGGGRLQTVEASASRLAVGAALLRELDLGLVDTHNSLFEGQLGLLNSADMFFLDGNHYAEPTLRYVDEALARMARPALLVLDDIAGYSRDMDRAWASLAGSNRFTQTALAGDIGILLAGDTEMGPFP